MRGKDKYSFKDLLSTRITPAYAGKRRRKSELPETLQDHPRLCGEKFFSVLHCTKYLGSPPPMRGKGLVQHLHMGDGGITPAYAGKSDNAGDRCRLRRDHPRLCGEKSGIYKAMCCRIGSPPPMRGKGIVKLKNARFMGITPAYAGKRFGKAVISPYHRDHPRLCGEKTISTSFSRFSSGSPPPMRGKDFAAFQHLMQLGITPAYAGKRKSFSGCRKMRWDHPRLCGEKTKKIPKQRYFFHQPASFSFSLQYT